MKIKQSANCLDLEIERLSIIEIWTLLLYLIDIERENVEDFLRSWKLPVKNIKSIKNILTWLEFRHAITMVDRKPLSGKTSYRYVC